MSQQKAFTLIETIVTVFIVAILASFVFVQINDSINSGKDAKRKADIALLANAVVSYSADHYSSKPIDEDGCDIEGTCSSDIENSLKLYLSTFPKDPNPAAHYKYRSDGTNCFVSTVLSNGKTFEYECDIDAVASGLPVPGACGVAANTPSNGYASSIINWPTNNFCATGTVNPVSPVFPNQGTSTAWTCIGDFLGPTITCTAYRAQDAICGTRERRFADADTSYGSYTTCSIGTASPASPAFPAKGASTTWSCLGINNGTTDTCIAEHTGNAVCGTANRTTATAYADAATSYGTDTFCALGTTTTPAFPIKGASTSWTCAGLLGGTSASCVTYHSANAVCGTAQRTFADAATSYGSYTFCSTGTTTTPAFPAKGASTSWTCGGVYTGTSATCTAQHSLNGVCGSSNGGSFVSAPTANLCSTGTASAVAGSGPWTWTCIGLLEGTTASCSANKIDMCNGAHTSQQCWNAGGTVVSTGSCNICKFATTCYGSGISSGGSAGACCPGGWTRYQLYTQTRAVKCQYVGCGSNDPATGCTEGRNDPYGCGHPCISSGTGWGFSGSHGETDGCTSDTEYSWTASVNSCVSCSVLCCPIVDYVGCY
jgi:prepilin-type N-terminal cleavage/methylation domain-containing protein